VEHIRFTLMAWLNGILLTQCLGWQLLGERYRRLSVGLEYKHKQKGLNLLVLTKQRLGDVHNHLKRRGYNDKVIESGFSKASEINRNDLLE
jgi:hypothetical protein